MPLQYDPDALEDIPRHQLERIRRKVDWLWENRDKVFHFPLSHDLAGMFKRKFGDYRVVYTFEEPDDMTIRRVGLRDTVYQEF